MITNIDEEQFIDKSSVLVNEIKSIVKKVQNLATSSVKIFNRRNKPSNLKNIVLILIVFIIAYCSIWYYDWFFGMFH
ncbi:MAG: hypothetical protein ACXAEU_00810 [Candidatus Hodarchaeales archaeon]|jgi:hypothetical protein